MLEQPKRKLTKADIQLSAEATSVKKQTLMMNAPANISVRTSRMNDQEFSSFMKTHQKLNRYTPKDLVT